MPQNPTIPPVPKRPPAKLIKIPPVTETHGSRSHIVDPYAGIAHNRHGEAPRRQHTSSEVDLEVVRHAEQLKGIERRVVGLEGIAESVDAKLDKISDTLTTEIHTRKLDEAARDEVKVLADQKTKRFQALLIAIPTILSISLGFITNQIMKPTPDYKTTTVVLSEYTEEAAKCLKEQKTREAFQLCIRTAQLKNTPNFEK